MNENVVADQIKRAFPNYSQVSKDLLRTERMVGNSSYSVTFFDYSSNVLSEEFDIDTYQSKFISSEYYKTEGTLQWNHYLVFVVPEGTIGKNTKLLKRKNELEKNRHYTRKYVVEDSDLSGFLEPRSMVDMVSTVEPNSSPYARWVQQLNSVDLDGLHLSDESTSIIEGLKTNKVTKERPNSTVMTVDTEVDSKIEPLNPVEYLEIENFKRSKPSSGIYPIGQFTMLYGPNGIGKTSFLEALEMVYCGQAARNPKVKDSSLKVGIKYKNIDTTDFYDSTDLQKYRSRDHYWYENLYDGKNRLADNFSKYNFFDTDSAARLSAVSGAQKSLVDAFISLSLGDKVNHLEDRILKFQKMLKTEINRNDATLLDLTKRESETIALINGLQQKDLGIEKEYLLLKNLFQKLVSAFQLPQLKEIVASDFSLRIESSLNSCLKIRNSVSWEPKLTPEIILTQVDDVESEIREFSEYLEKQKNSVKAIIQWKNRIKSLSKLESDLERFERFSQTCDVSLVPNLTKTLEALHRKAKSFGTAIDIISRVLPTEKIKSQSVIDSLNELQLIRTDLSKQAIEVNRKIQSLQSTVELVNQLINEIRTQSKALLSRSPQLSECPVCLTSHPIGKLKDIVEKLQTAHVPSGEISKLIEAKNKINGELFELDKSETILKKLQSVEPLLKAEGLILDKVSDFPDNLTRIKQQLEGDIKQIGILETIGRTLAAEGLSESEFIELRKNLENGALQIGIQVFSSSQVSLFSDKINAEKIIAENELKKLAQPEATRESLTKIRVRLGQTKSDDEIFVELKRRNSELLSAQSELATLQAAIHISENDELSVVEQQLRSINQQLIQFRATERAEREKGSVLPVKERELNEIKKTIHGLREIGLRFERASTVLANIIEKDSKSQNLERFLGTYKHFILKIFTRIHRPVEFSDINIKGSEIQLTRTEDNVEVPLSMISTGQRAALALSIFLSLNLSLQKGPPVILIDDPVAHVDDLNTLAFLDYLREIVASGIRQVVFATADSKMAQLMRRKFDFLGKEFISYPSISGDWKIQALDH